MLNFTWPSRLFPDCTVRNIPDSQENLVIEVDGDTHLSNAEKVYDAKRQREIEKLGIFFLRFTNGEIYNGLDWVMETIEFKVKELIQNLPTPLDPEGAP